MDDKQISDMNRKAMFAAEVCRKYCQYMTNHDLCGEKCVFWYPMEDVPFDGCRISEYATSPGDWNLEECDDA